jgi:regulator of sigma E protease
MAVGEAFQTALRIPWERTKDTLTQMGAMFQRRDTSGVGGPVAIAGALAEAADKGWPQFVSIIGLISIALGVFNLLPFPALDGGRLVFLGYEVVTRRKPNERFETTVHVMGILFLLSVMVLVTYRDIFGGAAAEEDAAPAAQPAAAPAPEPAATEPAPEPAVEAAPAAEPALAPEPAAEAAPAAEPAAEPVD